MSHFIAPREKGSLFHVAIVADDPEGAFRMFAALWWTYNLGAVGVWQGLRLVGRVLPGMRKQTGRIEPFLLPVKP